MEEKAHDGADAKGQGHGLVGVGVKRSFRGLPSLPGLFPNPPQGVLTPFESGGDPFPSFDDLVAG